MNKTTESITTGANQDSPQPLAGDRGATDPGPRSTAPERQNPYLLTPPSTDAGTVPNLKFSFSQAPNRLERGGWAREVTSASFRSR